MDHNTTSKTNQSPPVPPVDQNPLEGRVLIRDVTDVKILQTIAEHLWRLLDDIDTASDLFKPDLSEPKSLEAFYKYSLRRAAERGKYLESLDGFNLVLPEE